MIKHLVTLALTFGSAIGSGSEFESAIQPISDLLFEQMSYSWKETNPVPLQDLRYVSVSHWGFDEEVHQGCLIVHQSVANEVVEIFKEIFEGQFPIEKMLLVDLYEGNDERSATDNNSYSFCSRAITGKVGEFSNHSYGLAIDINPLFNPYCRGELLVPKAGAPYLNRENKVQGMIDTDSICYQAFAKRGWDWGGNWMPTDGYVDYHHFEKDPNEFLGGL